jgi:hypothetical protein
VITVVLLHAIFDFLVEWKLLRATQSRAENLRRSTAAVEVAVAFSLAGVCLLKVLQHIAGVEGLVLEVTLCVFTVVKTRAVEAVKDCSVD